MYRLGLDVGGTKLSLGLVEENGRLLAKQKVPVHHADFSAEWLAKQAILFLEGNRIDRMQVAFCGVGVPGTVDVQGTTIVKAPNLLIENMPLAADLERLLHMPVRIVQDSRAAAWGEYTAGCGRNSRLLVCVTLGTGIGTGIVMDGKIYSGATNGAGELGHLPVESGGRICSCGKRGCLECYAAGKGLTQTAQEMYGEQASCETLFCKAQEDDTEAAAAIEKAVEMLGSAMVSMINLMAPDCVVFSGGLSEQKEWFVDPLIRYIEAHRYRHGTQDGLTVRTAALGADAPLIGAAMLPAVGGHRRPLVSASVMCADLLHLERDLQELELGGVDYLHWDVMDGHFVPNLMLPIDMLNRIRDASALPFDIHLMTDRPEWCVESLRLCTGDIVSVHWESTPHVQRVLASVREKGAHAALALNPSTPIECVREVLEDVDSILVMTVNPGFAGQTLVVQMLEKIRRLRRYLDELGYACVRIEVDGNCSFQNLPFLQEAGADTFVVGSSSVFSTGADIRTNMKQIDCALHRAEPAWTVAAG